MKMKTNLKRIVSFLLCVMLTFCLMDLSMFEISAATTDTRYSDKRLQNGNFEENVNNYKFSSNYTQPLKTNVPYWDTTAYEGKFEFFTDGAPHFTRSSTNYKKVAEGKVAAELNADEESTIYQRINTVAGSTYTWGLDHRGRDTTDRMVLIIGPEQKDSSGNAVDPSKPSKDGDDQFMRITNWLKKQYGVTFPEFGCSQKFVVYTKPFAASGKFVGDSSNEDENISFVKSDVINQEWSVWVISSSYCNTGSDTDGNGNPIKSINGWSKYGTNAVENTEAALEDIMKGASSSLGYNCTYTVPYGQTETLFAFCSVSSGRLNGSQIIDAPTYGNMLDSIDFKLYQPLVGSTTEGGAGKVNDNLTIESKKHLYSIVQDGTECTIYALKNDSEPGHENYTFQGAYITVNNDDGTSTTRFVKVSEFNFEPPETETEIEQYYYTIKVDSPTTIHLLYAKAPFVLYDSNGGEPYFFSPDNTQGGNLVGFGEYFQKVVLSDNGGETTYLDTSEYYYNCTSGENVNATTPGYYKSHAALPNTAWGTNDEGRVQHKFCGWSVLDKDGNTVILDGEHTITYQHTSDNDGMVTFTNKDGSSVPDLTLDASHGVTLTAQWQFVNRAYAQTLDDGEYVNSVLGGEIHETLNHTEVTEYKDGDRVASIDALGDVGDSIVFTALPDTANHYVFDGWYEQQEDGSYSLKSTSTSISVTVEKGMNTYYARFKKQTVPVVFKYTETGSSDGYDYYEKSVDNQYGKYYQAVPFETPATKPTGDSKSVTTWYTSPTERGSEYIFDFSKPITEKTTLYAGPSYTFNYFNYFVFKEPWKFNTYGTLKLGNKYIDLKNDPDVSDFHVYLKKGTTVDESKPSPTEVKNHKDTIKIGKSNPEKLIFNMQTNTGKTFNRAGATYEDFYLFNMKTPVWVMFDITYKGITYTSSVKDRSLYNNIDTYMKEATNGFYTSYPPETQEELRNAQTDLLNKIKAMYDAVAKLGITEPTKYAASSVVSGLPNESSTDKKYTFESSTAIRNIEPWGLKYSFTVTDHAFSEFSDYGAVVLTDKDGLYKETPPTIANLLSNENAVMYSNSNGNVYDGDNGMIDVYYVNNLLATDFDKNTYVVFFVKDAQGKVYYSDIVTNTYNDVASEDPSPISDSIVKYAKALTDYYALVEQAKNNTTSSGGN